jgi:hypothetical protein
LTLIAAFRAGAMIPFIDWLLNERSFSSGTIRHGGRYGKRDAESARAAG